MRCFRRSHLALLFGLAPTLAIPARGQERVPAEAHPDASAAAPAPPLPSPGAVADSSTDPDASPLPPVLDEGFGAVAAIEAPPREVTRRTVDAELIQKIPGTSGDAVRSIEVLPGVARTSLDAGDPILRGAAWNDTVTYIDGAYVPYIFHIGGVKSAFNSRLVERVELYPGNFSARYGRAMGGIIDVKPRAPRTDRPHALVELSVLDSMALVEAPLSDDTAVAFAGRRSNIDFFFEQFVPEDAYAVTAAPLYWDYQGLVTHRLGAGHTLRVVASGSHDSMRLFLSNPSDLDPALRGNLEFASAYHLGLVSLDSELSPQVEQRLQLSLGTFNGSTRLGPLVSEFDFLIGGARAEWSVDVSRAVRMNLGLDAELIQIFGSYQGPPPPQSEGDPALQPLSTLDTLRVEDTFYLARPAAYAEAELRPTGRVLLVPGVRVDHYGELAAATVDPRLTARLEATGATTVKGGAGVFSQPPIYYEFVEGVGNPDLEPSRALHTSAGVEQRLGNDVRVGLEGFYKRLTHRVVATEGLVPPRFVNDGVGRIYGAELSAQYRTERTFAFLAYTWSRSERRDRSDGWRLFELDQPHILAITASRSLGRGWEVGGRMRVVSGNPYTPIAGAVYDAGADGYVPFSVRQFSARNPVFHQLDVRVEKAWHLRGLELAVYLDVMNAYNAKNQEGLDYSFDYTERESYSGLPITPNLGLRAEL